MSFLRSAAAWERTEVGGTDKLVLLALADFENDKNGKCYPSREDIAEKCGVSVPTVRRALAQLKAAGLVSWIEGRSGIANEYTFKFAKKQGATSPTGQNDPVIGSNLSPHRVKLTPQPGINQESTGVKPKAPSGHTDRKQRQLPPDRQLEQIRRWRADQTARPKENVSPSAGGHW